MCLKIRVSGEFICKSTAEQRRTGTIPPVRYRECQEGAPRNASLKVEVTPRGRGPDDHLLEKSRSNTSGPVERAPVPERALRDASLGVEVTPRERGAHGHLSEERRRNILGSESARESASLSI